MAVTLRRILSPLLFESVIQDLRYGLRRLRRERSTSVAALLTVALAVGLATAVYSVAHSVLIQDFPYQNPERLLAVWKATPAVDFIPLPVPELLDIKARSRAVEDIAGFTRAGYVVLSPKGARWADAFEVTTNLFDVLGVHPIVGRTFRTDDGERGREKVALIGEPLWRDVFDADPRIVGQIVRLRGEHATSGTADEYRIVGVIPTELEIFYPTRLRAQMYVPRLRSPEDVSEQARSIPALIAIARLRPGVPVREGIADAASTLAISASEHPASSIPGASPRVASWHDEIVGRTRPAFLLLAAASGVLILIGCANVAHLLLASRLKRRPELIVRLALGCSRGRLLRQLLTEHLVVAATGGLAGVALAAWATPVLRRLAPESLPRASEIRMDPTALAVALAISLFVWVISGVLPALSLAQFGDGIDSRARTVARGRGRRVLIFSQTTLVVTLMGAAALLAKGTWRLSTVDLGFHASGVLVAQLIVPPAPATTPSPTQRQSVEQGLIDRLARDPRFANVSIASELPFSFGVLRPVRKAEREKPTWTVLAETSEQYLSLLGLRLADGRWLDAGDRGNKHAVVINQTLDRYVFQRGGLGQRLFIQDEWRTVVGIVTDVTEIGELRGGVIRRAGLGSLTLPAAYLPLGSLDSPAHFLLFETPLDASSATAAVQNELRQIEPEGALRRTGWLEDRVNTAGADVRFAAVIVGVFALGALVLAAVGLYGVLSNAVQERRVEIGIRTALGASPGHVTWMVTRGALGSVAAGCSIGVGLVLLAGRVLRAFLFEVSPSDPTALGATVCFFVLVATVAAYRPARSVGRLDPARALRSE